MQLLAELVLKHTDAAALDACLRSLAHCASQGSDTIQVPPSSLPEALLLAPSV